MTSLTELANHYGSDKGWHLYTDYYEELFRGLLRKPVKILEIGVDGGGSLKMWHDWFYHQDTRIYGIEIQDKGLVLYPKTQLFITDATSPNAVFDITRAVGPFDIIIEDASHYTKDQKTLLEQWFPHLKPGGIWITEDTHSGYHYPWNNTDEVPFVHSLREYIDRLNENGRDQCGKPTDSDIEEIIFRKSLVIIKKR